MRSRFASIKKMAKEIVFSLFALKAHVFSSCCFNLVVKIMGEELCAKVLKI